MAEIVLYSQLKNEVAKKNASLDSTGPPMLSPSIRLPTSIPRSRPIAPFAATVLRCVNEGRPRSGREWQPLADLAATLDRLIGTLVGSVRIVTTVAFERPSIQFTVGDAAFAMSPLGHWNDEEMEPDVTSNGDDDNDDPGRHRLVAIRHTNVDNTTVPLDVTYVVPLAYMGAWIARRMGASDQDAPEAMHTYKGPRVLGEDFIMDIFLPTLFRGCQLL